MSNSRGKGRAVNTAPKTRSIGITITVAVVLLLFIAAMFINSTFIRRQVTAIEANGMKFTAAEYQFFYISTINEYTSYVNNNYGDYASSMLPDSTKSLESQTHPLTNETWADYYKKSTRDNLLYFSGAYQEASASGYALTDEDYAVVDAQIDEYVDQISLYYGMTFKEYIDNQFGAGSGVNEKLYRDLSKKQYYVNKYAQSVNDAFEYSESELDEYYAGHKDELDFFKYRFFTVRAETLSEEDFETTEEYEAADAAAIESARAQAAEYVATISDEQDFIEKAREYNETSYEKESSTLYHISGDEITTTFADWIKDASRQAGDMCSEPTNTDESQNRAFYVLYFLKRIDNEYPTVNVQLMLITGETVSSSDYLDENGETDEDAYSSALEDAALALETKANALLREWEDNGGTVDYLTEYYTENTSITYGSLDEYTATISGNLYENIRYSYTQDDLADAWMHDASRQEGDITAVKVDDTTWYLLYFVGQDMNYSDYLADTAKREADLDAWEAAFSSTAAVTRWGMKLV